MNSVEYVKCTAANELIECRVDRDVRVFWAVKITLKFDFHLLWSKREKAGYCMNQQKADSSRSILSSTFDCVYVRMQAARCTFLLHSSSSCVCVCVLYIRTHSYSLDPVNEHECAFVRYFILTFTSHTHTLTSRWPMPKNQWYAFVRFFFSFFLIRYVKSRLFFDRLKIFLSIRIQSVQLSAKYKALYTHMYTYVRIYISIYVKLRKEKIENL